MVQDLTKVVDLSSGESQATGQVTSHRSGQVRLPVRSQASDLVKGEVRSGQVTGEVTGQVRATGKIIIFQPQRYM